MYRKFGAIFFILLFVWSSTISIFATDTALVPEDDDIPPYDMSPLYDQGIYDLGMVAGFDDNGKLIRYDKLIEPTIALVDDGAILGTLFFLGAIGIIAGHDDNNDPHERIRKTDAEKEAAKKMASEVYNNASPETKQIYEDVGNKIVNGQGVDLSDFSGIDGAFNDAMSLTSLITMGEDYIFANDVGFVGNFNSSVYSGDYQWLPSCAPAKIHFEPDFYITMPVLGSSRIMAFNTYRALAYGFFENDFGTYFAFEDISNNDVSPKVSLTNCTGLTNYDYYIDAQGQNFKYYSNCFFLNSQDAYNASLATIGTYGTNYFFLTTETECIVDDSSCLVFTNLGFYKDGELSSGRVFSIDLDIYKYYWGQTATDEETPIAYIPSVNRSQGLIDGSVTVQPGDALDTDEDIDDFIAVISPSVVGQMVDTGYLADTATVPEEGTDTENPAIPYAPAIPNPEGFELPNIMVTKFPFCIPFDLYNSINSLVATPVPPRFEWEFYIESIGYSQTFIIDFEDFEELANIVRYFTGAGFVLGLILITRRLIKG